MPAIFGFLMLHGLIEQVSRGEVLKAPDIERLFHAMLNASLDQAKIAQLLKAWQEHPVYPELLVGGAKFLRANALAIPIPQTVRPLFDNCGTGGSGHLKFNTSTAAAIVAASCGVKIAKHGNRSASGRCGSADFLSELGFPLELSSQHVVRLLEQTGLTFFFAPQFHPLMRNVAAIRKQLGTRTIFNLLGPLANPVAPDGQLVGVSSRSLLLPMAEALMAIGCKRALVVHASSGLDEIGSSEITFACEVRDGKLRQFEINPADYGLLAPGLCLKDGTAAESAQLFIDMLGGSIPVPSEAVILNAGFLLYLSGLAKSIEDGLEQARQSLKSLAAKRYFDTWIKKAKSC